MTTGPSFDPPGEAAAPIPLVQAEGLTRSFLQSGGLFGRKIRSRVLRGVDLSVSAGEAVGLVGESGCGKSTLARVLLHLIAATSGRVLFEGRDIARLPTLELRRLRKRMQMVFQDPYGSLDPRRNVGAQIADGIRIHALAPAAAMAEATGDLLRQVGLGPEHANRLPHEFSGGQRQRIAIARALATKPDFLVADEPVSALDVSVQAQVVNLLGDLRADLGLALLLISHDLHVVRHLCDRISVMYLGRIVEVGPTAEVFRNPCHPYTRMLLAATPSMRHTGTPSRRAITGEMPGPASLPSGCAFRTRCPAAKQGCAETVPKLEPFGGSGRQVACLRAAELG